MPATARKKNNVSESGAGQVCAASSGQSIDCTLASLTNGADTPITVTSSVASSVAPDPSFSYTAPAPPNATLFPYTTLFRSARNVTLTVAKAFQDTSVDAGTGSHTFTIT